MGRRRLPQNAHLPAHVYFRNGRYYFGRNQLAAGSNFAQALKTIEQDGLLPRSSTIKSAPAQHVRYLWGRAKLNAKSKNVPFDLTIEQVSRMIEATGQRCPIAGVRFDYLDRMGNKRFRPWAPSLDRIRPEFGYTVANCRIVCAYVNLAMNEFGEDVFVAVARHVAKHSRRKLREAVNVCGKAGAAEIANDIAKLGI